MSTPVRAGDPLNYRRPSHRGNDTLVRVNGQPERWLVAARLSRMAKRDRERGDELINGIRTQDRQSADWAGHEGHVIIHVTRDRNISGAMPPWERPELGPWLTDPVKLVQYDGIVAYDVQRLSRGGNFDIAWLRRWAEEHGKKLYVIKERLSWPDPRDGMLWAVEAERAQQDLIDMTEKTTRETRALRDAGKLVGKPPFGYEIAGEKYDKRLVPTQTGRTYVPEIFRLVIAGWSGKRIAAWLNSEGILRASSPWWQTYISHVIRNPVYKGFRCEYEITPPDEVEITVDGEVEREPWTGKDKRIIRYRYGDKWVEQPRHQYGRVIHRCEELVDATTWKQANDALDNRKPAGPKAIDCAMLSGALYCPFCQDKDSPMYRIRSGMAAFRAKQGKTTKDYAYYRCGGRGADRVSCTNIVWLDRVDAAVDRIIGRHFNREIIEYQIRRGNEAQIRNRLEEIAFELRQLPSRGLPRADEDAERAALRDEEDRVAATEVIEDKAEPRGTGRTYRQVWEQLPVTERGAWLAEEGFKVYASKAEVRVTLDGYQAVAAL